MLKGKKIKAQKIIFNLFFLIKQSFFFNPIFIFFNALDILRPTLELSLIKIGKKNYTIPVPVIFFRQYLIVLRWFKRFFQKPKTIKNFSAKLFTEINFLILKKNQSEL
jgi:ribosomal protein S7